jgi:hypothetical protein
LPRAEADTMLKELLVAAALVAITVAMHSAGFGLILAALQKHRAAPPTRALPITWLLIRVAWLLIVLHTLEITVWAGFYRWDNCLPDAESAFYFSGVTYTTLGYGDLLLPREWRMLGPVQGLTGILMCGLSAGLFFAVVAGIYNRHERREATSSRPAAERRFTAEAGEAVSSSHC